MTDTTDSNSVIEMTEVDRVGVDRAGLPQKLWDEFVGFVRESIGDQVPPRKLVGELGLYMKSWTSMNRQSPHNAAVLNARSNPDVLKRIVAEATLAGGTVDGEPADGARAAQRAAEGGVDAE